MKLVAVLAVLFASACCSSLPRQTAKQLPFPAPRAEYESILETTGHYFDAKREQRKIPVKVYSPAGRRGRLPVVVFSHGIGENHESYAWLGRALAKHGLVAVHITHAGTDKAVLERGYRHLYRATKEKINWINRPLDVSAVLDQLALRSDTDMERVAVAGHSAGAFTAFALAGMQVADGTSLRDPRVKAIVPMSMPRMPGVVPPGGYDAIDVPVLNVTGTCDTSLIYRTFPRHRRIPFESSRAPRQYLVTFDGVTHDTFSAVTDPRHDAIAALTIAFLRATFGDAADARAWFDEPGRGETLGTPVSVERKTGGAR